MKIPALGGIANHKDIANAALFFASDESQDVNAVILPVDGVLMAKQ